MTAAFDIKTAPLLSGPLTYRICGEGPPLVHLHAGGGSRVSAPLAGLAESHRVYMPIIPGFDGTPVHESVRSMQALSDLVAAFVREVVGSPADIMGISFGAHLALWFAVRHPDLVDHLVLECVSGFRRGGLMLAEDPDARRKLFVYPERVPPETRTPEQLASNRTAPTLYAKGVDYDDELEAQLGEIRARSLILTATQDQVIPQETGIMLKRKIPQSHLTYVYDAAHSLETDQPVRVLRIVKAFLERGEAFIVPQRDAADTVGR